MKKQISQNRKVEHYKTKGGGLKHESIETFKAIINRLCWACFSDEHKN